MKKHIPTEITVESMIESLKSGPSTRFSKTDFQCLVYAILSDPDFKAKRYLTRSDTPDKESSYDFNRAIYKFMHRLLKHAGMMDSRERAAVIETFEYGPRDVEWIVDAVDEATYIYTECGKNMHLFRNKMMNLSIRKMTRKDGKESYKKAVMNRSMKERKKN